jgi:hypothetical protein
VVLGWADNNRFDNMVIQATDAPGSGSAIHHIRQPAGSDNFDFLPSENIFVLPSTGCPTCTAITGDSGKGVGTILWPYQIGDSGGLPNTKGVRGWLSNGEFFDTSSVSRFAFQKRLNIYSRDAVAEFGLTGFMAPSDPNGAGHISTIGTAVNGDASSFTTDMIGKYIFAMTEYRRITAVAGPTTATIAAAFTDDLPAGTTYSISTGASMFMFSDGSGNLGTFDATSLKLYSNNTNWATLGSDGSFSNRGTIVGIGGDLGLSNAGGNTLTAAQIINGIVRRTAGGAQTDTTPTAAAIVAAIPNAQVGMTFTLKIYNNSGGTHTLGLGTGVTIATGFTSVLTTTAAQRHTFTFRLANVTASSEAVTVYSDGQGAY